MTAVKAPAGMDSGVIVKEFRNRFGAIIANGQGSMKGQIFRIAHLGYFDFADLFAVVAGLEIILNANGYPVAMAPVLPPCRKFTASRRAAANRDRVNARLNILIAEPLAPAGIELFQAQPGWNTIVSNPKEYAQHLADADALLVRSAVQVDQRCARAGAQLRVIGRAGVGVDNVDLDAATAAGVLVMNTPGGNAISVAEHTLALMLAMARHIPQASASTTRRQVGKEEVPRQRTARQNARHRGTRQHRPRSGETRPRLRNAHRGARSLRHRPDRPGSRRGADGSARALRHQRLHHPARRRSLPRPQGMLSHAAFAAMKPGVRIVNCARGELVDEAALLAAIQSGKVAGAAARRFQRRTAAGRLSALRQ